MSVNDRKALPNGARGFILSNTEAAKVAEDVKAEFVDEVLLTSIFVFFFRPNQSLFLPLSRYEGRKGHKASWLQRSQ